MTVKYDNNPKLKHLGRFIDQYFILLEESTVLPEHHIYDAYEAVEDVETNAFYQKNLVKKGQLFLVSSNGSGERKMDKEAMHRYVKTAITDNDAAAAVLTNLKKLVKEYSDTLDKLGLPKEDLLAFANIK